MSIDKLIPYYLALPPWAKDAGAQWMERPVWPWHDAVIWVASRRGAYMKMVSASRAYADGHYRDAGIAARTALWAVDEALHTIQAVDAARALFLALQRGEVASEGRRTLDDVATPIQATVWADAQFKSEDHLRAFAALGPRDGTGVWFWRVGLGRDGILSAFPPHAGTAKASKPRKLFDRKSEWKDLETWYIRRIEGAPALGYSREQDEIAGEAVGIPRENVRNLRREHAPEAWQKAGKKKTQG